MVAAVIGAALIGAVAATVGAAALQAGRSEPLDVWAFLLVVVAVVTTLGLRRTRPVLALAVAIVATGGYLLAGYPYGPIQLCMIVAMFEVARRCSLKVSLLACGLAAVVASACVAARFSRELESPLLMMAAWMGWVVLPWSLGALANAIGSARERARQQLVTRVALEERMKIAADVHDIAGHGFALVAMQAGVALLVFDEQPDQARTSLNAIKETSAKALAELRGMLDAIAMPKAAGLTGLPDLVEQVRAGGLRVHVEVEPFDLAEDIDAVAYRVVQESLTNVLRHAGSSSADVRIAQQDDELVVQVVDRGQAKVAPRVGRGLSGMRRRVEDIGGRLEAGPRAGGGFGVVARLPLVR